MAELPLQLAEIGELRRRASEERRRADKAAELAVRFEARAADCPERLRTVYRRGAQLHRRMHERQLAAARLHEAYAERLERQAGRAWPAPPPFMTAVAQALGARGATAALYGRGGGIPVLVASSDPTAKTVYNLETSAGEGPITTAVAEGRPVPRGRRGTSRPLA